MKSLLIALALAFSPSTFASEEISPWICPTSLDGNPEKISLEIESRLNKKEVAHAIQLGSVCASFGSNIDVMILGPVLDALHSSLERKVGHTENIVMMGLLKKCEDKDPEGGSMARSAAAHCQLNVLHGFYSALIVDQI